jgi:hypothetical protein
MRLDAIVQLCTPPGVTLRSVSTICANVQWIWLLCRNRQPGYYKPSHKW